MGHMAQLTPGVNTARSNAQNSDVKTALGKWLKLRCSWVRPQMCLGRAGPNGRCVPGKHQETLHREGPEGVQWGIGRGPKVRGQGPQTLHIAIPRGTTARSACVSGGTN